MNAPSLDVSLQGAFAPINMESAATDLQVLYRELEPYGGGSYSPLVNVLQDYRDSANYQQAPLTILLLEVSAVALFYVILIALVIVERQADEIALLRSRGATTFQVAAMYSAMRPQPREYQTDRHYRPA